MKQHNAPRAVPAKSTLVNAQELHDPRNILLIPRNRAFQLLVHPPLRPATAKINKPGVIVRVDNNVAVLCVAPDQTSPMEPVDRLADLRSPLPASLFGCCRYISIPEVPQRLAGDPFAEQSNDVALRGVDDIAVDVGRPLESSAASSARVPGLGRLTRPSGPCRTSHSRQREPDR